MPVQLSIAEFVVYAKLDLRIVSIQGSSGLSA